MQIQTDIPLAPFTSFKCGGRAEKAIFIDNNDNVQQIIQQNGDGPLWLLGYGSNMLISDKGLPGTTLIFRSGTITQDGTTLIADAGVWWDDLVQYAIKEKLWGLEFTSAIPGGVGAAVVGNIAAYGQAVADTLQWAEIIDVRSSEVTRMQADELGLIYRRSTLLQDDRSLTVVRAAFALSPEPTKELEYDSALVQAREHGYDPHTLQGRRDTILKAREAAGSLWDYRNENADKTAGSFFRNPLVDAEAAERIMSYDETGKSLELLKKMNLVHGGEMSRVSAAHVLLAAGFTRGQRWGDVRLHPKHVLKIENAGNATAQNIYDVADEIIMTVKTKLGVDIEPEIRFMGDFS